MPETALPTTIIGGDAAHLSHHNAVHTLTNQGVSLDRAGGKDKVSTVASATGATTVNLADGNLHDVTMTGNVTFTFSGASASVSCSFTLYLRQDGIGGRTVTWPGTVRWDSGVAPTISTAANKLDILAFESHDNGANWHGFMAGRGMA